MSIAQNQIRDSYTSIIAVSEEAPSTFSLGDIYYNTTTNFLYTAIKDDEDNLIWGDGESPIANHLYCDISTNVFYGVSSGVLFANIGTGEVTNPLSNDLDANNHKILNLANGTSAKDAINKSQLDAKADIADVILKTERGVANGVAVLDSNSVVPLSNLPLATTQDVGLVKPDGTTLTVDSSGTLYATQQNFYTPPLLFCTWFDHIVNQVSWLRADTFSWQDGGVYSAVYSHLIQDLAGLKVNGYAWEDTQNNVVRYYTLSDTPSVGDDIYIQKITYTQVGISMIFSADVITQINSDTEIVGFFHTYTRTSNLDANNLVIDQQTTNYLPFIAKDGHRIFLSDTTIDASYDGAYLAQQLYDASGISWNFVLDLENQRFKLPRTKFGFTGLRDSVGKSVDAGLPNIKNDSIIYNAAGGGTTISSGPLTYVSNAITSAAGTGIKYGGVIFDASLANSVYGNADTVQPPATQMYLYFYVGNYIEPAISQTAGINSELFNGKVDLDIINLSNSGKSRVSNLGMPSDTYEDLVLGSSGTQYTAPADGYVFLSGQSSVGDGIIQLTSGFYNSNNRSYGQYLISVLIPVRKNNIFIPYYDGTLSNVTFRFIYAVGSEWEA